MFQHAGRVRRIRRPPLLKEPYAKKEGYELKEVLLTDLVAEAIDSIPELLIILRRSWGWAFTN
jgi:hypothetical protein